MPDVAGTEYLAIANGADPTGSSDSAYAIQAAANTYGAAGAGDLELPVGTFLIGSPITVPNGVRIRGAGIGRTILKAAFTTGAVLSRTAASGADSVEHIAVEDLTIDCVAGPAGTVDGIAIDTSVSSSVVCRDVPIADVEILNARLGIRSDGNNASAGPMFNQRTVRDAIFRNCLIGVIATGTYAQHIIDCQFYGCTAAAIGTGGVTPGAPVVSGTGPATLTQIRGCHVEGLGNLSGTGTAAEHGIYIGCSDPIITDCHIENVSRFALCVSTGEGYAALVRGISVWGAGWSGIYLTGVGAGQQGVLSGFSLYNVAQSTAANTGQQGALLVGSGNWTVTDGWIPTATEAPPPTPSPSGSTATTATPSSRSRGSTARTRSPAGPTWGAPRPAPSGSPTAMASTPPPIPPPPGAP